MITLEMVQRQWPHGDQHIPGLIEGIVASAATVFPKYNVDTAMAVAHFMAQASEECGCGLEMLENMNYTAQRLRQIFPTHFTPTMAERWAHNPRVIADIAYGGRMGNAPYPSDDGWSYRGAGLTQVTGRDGVTALQKKLDEMTAGFNIIDNPELIVDPEYTLECGVADWVVCGCLSYAKADDVINETKHLNGGLNGLAERRRQLALWKKELGL